MKRILCGAAAFWMMCTLTACREAPQPLPPQSEFMESVNEVLEEKDPIHYIGGLQENEVLCEEAQSAADLCGQVQCTCDKPEEEKAQLCEENRQYMRKFLDLTRQLDAQGITLRTFLDTAEELTPEDIAEKILQENVPYTQMGWCRGTLPDLDRKGNWDGLSGRNTYFVILSVQPILADTSD